MKINVGVLLILLSFIAFWVKWNFVGGFLLVGGLFEINNYWEINLGRKR